MRERIVIAVTGYTVGFTLIFFFLYGGAAQLGQLLGTTEVPLLPYEDRIPFLPVFSFAYVSLYPMMWMALFFFRTKNEIRAVFRIFVVELLLAVVILIAFPTEVPRIKIECLNLASCVLYLSDIVNLEGNAIPSLHVAFAWTSRDLYATRCSPKMYFLFSLWAFVISLSTLFTYQHRLLDVWGGLLLASLVERYFIRKMSFE